MAITRAQSPEDHKMHLDAIAARLREAREGLSATQTDFAVQISITRDRLASYEDGRATLRCDVALRLCRQFFISEFWLATGSADEAQAQSRRKIEFSDLDARLTMALAVESAALACPPGASFASAFDPFLRRQYSVLAAQQSGFPRIKPLPSDTPLYLKNAVAAMTDFWRRNLSHQQWEIFITTLLSQGQALHRQTKAKKV